MRYLLALTLAACSNPADEACAVAWSHGYATGLVVDGLPRRNAVRQRGPAGQR